ncbi:FAD:protein FMN transferase [Lutimaribacter marinistellae]|uniref:FAD:protein FMN transferase n=1 Tax=Lutimaribacter marinistellae TaxID=1820329 RepID=A0ABV7TEJ0_9RHOB
MRPWPLLPAILALSACFEDEPETIRLSGETMGTTYNVIAIGTGLDEDALADAVADRLQQVNATMSNWDPDSEVSRFSTTDSTAPQNISAEFAEVMQVAGEVHEKSGGAFDVTLGPLIELWGFGPREPGDPVPSDAEIAAALAEVGQARLIELDAQGGTLTKSEPGVGINLSAIAKGYGIDAVAGILRDAGVEDYMVEIGGDLVTLGENDKGDPWQIGIEVPEPGARAIQMIIPVSGKGMATSGDYRNFFERDGVRYSHILNPVTGRPVTHRTTSVTVLAESAMLADAWATALLALGAEAGLDVAERHDIAAYFISRDVTGDENSYITRQSGAFDAALAQD